MYVLKDVKQCCFYHSENKLRFIVWHFNAIESNNVSVKCNACPSKETTLGSLIETTSDNLQRCMPCLSGLFGWPCASGLYKL